MELYLPKAQTQIFIPNGKPVSSTRIWACYATILIFMSALITILFHNVYDYIVFEFIAVVIILLIININKQSISITISTLNNTSIYRYKNGWGKEAYTTINLLEALGQYRKIFNKASAGWILLLYKGKYLKSLISIKQNSKTDYNKEQLDQIFALIYQCKQLPSNK